MKEIIIWGTGRIGEFAYRYYKDNCNILFFVDSNPEKWNKTFYNLPIYTPEILKEKSYLVVIAVKRGRYDIEQMLKNKYRNCDYVFFIVEEKKTLEKNFNFNYELNGESTVVHFSGGLGNQMFQYAFYLINKKLGKNVYGNISSYQKLDVMPFQLDKVFKNIRIDYVENGEEKVLVNNILEMEERKRFLLYDEPFALKEVKEKETDWDLLKNKGGVYKGLFQTYKFAEIVRKELMNDFIFSVNKEKELLYISRELQERELVSVHIRRGDYLLNRNKQYYEGICTKEYYNKAIYLIKEKIQECKICFFSDDIEWVKENFVIPGAIYIEKNMFSDYKDWYDMYLMSICKHNIIANSTFSWWGAWLNRNPEKVVIAPERWVNGCDYKDIYPPEWICL